MEIIEGKSFEDQEIIIDGKYFKSCTFTKCTLLYTGGDFTWSKTKFIDCISKLLGPAARTQDYLKSIGGQK